MNMSPEEYRSSLLRAYKALIEIASLPLDDIADAINHADTVGPLLDPTMWMRQSPKMREDLAVVQALRAAVKAIPENMKDRIAQLAYISNMRRAMEEK